MQKDAEAKLMNVHSVDDRSINDRFMDDHSVGATEVDVMHFSFPAQLEQLEHVGERIRQFLSGVQNLSEPEVTNYNIELALQEICVNIVKHAYANQGGQIGMTARLVEQPLRLILTLSDQGVGFDPDVVAEPKLGELQEHGFGLFLVEQLMDEVEYQTTAEGNFWRLVKILPLDLV